MAGTIPDIGKQKRAKLAFFNAFLDLLAEKKYEELFVSDIVAASGYSRSAFYSNFEDKEQMLRDMLHFYVLTYVHATYDTYRDFPGDIRSSLYLPMLHTCQSAYEHRKFYHLLFAGRIPSCSLNEFLHRTGDYFRTVFTVNYKDWPDDFDWDMYWFVKGMGIFNFIIYWDQCGWKYSPEYVAKNAAKLLPNVSHVERKPDKSIVIVNDMSIPPG